MSAESSHEPDWGALRDLMPVAQKWAYFDHAAVAPLSAPAQEAINQWSQQATTEGDTVWPGWAARIEEIRATAARLVGAEQDEIALVPNTTAGINYVAEGLPWKSGDNLIVVAGEFPSNLYPWMNLACRGVEARVFQPHDTEIELGRLAELCDGRTRLSAISWVGYANGYRIDLDELVEVARQAGVLTFVDAIQGLGVFPLDVRQTAVDFLAADGHKWMLGPEGAGLFYVRREHLQLLRPLNVGWNSVRHAHDFTRIELNFRNSAARYEGGSQNMVGFTGFGASLDLLLRFGAGPQRSAVGNRVLQLNRQISDRLDQLGVPVISRRDENHGSGIVTFELPGQNPAEVRRRCLERGVALSVRDGRIRLSPHAYVNEEDIERLMTALQN